jgi:hypothetical protein
LCRGLSLLITYCAAACNANIERDYSLTDGS